MKRAVAAAGYRDVRPFASPDGVTTAKIDPQTGQLAGSACPVSREEFFIEGTEPTESCSQHGGGIINHVSPVSWLKSLFGSHKKTSGQKKG
jgi:membrane carboxypeptidase/penicillin-binding protein